MSVAVTLTNKYDDGASPPAAAVVVPSLDLNLGTVLFRANGVFEERWHPDPRRLEAVLARAIRPVRWDPAGQSLEVRVAAVGHSDGKLVRIPLGTNNDPHAAAAGLPVVDRATKERVETR